MLLEQNNVTIMIMPSPVSMTDEIFADKRLGRAVNPAHRVEHIHSIKPFI